MSKACGIVLLTSFKRIDFLQDDEDLNGAQKQSSSFKYNTKLSLTYFICMYQNTLHHFLAMLVCSLDSPRGARTRLEGC